MNDDKSLGEGSMMPVSNNDHDLLIQLSTKVDILLTQFPQLTEQINKSNVALVERVTALENKDSRDSEKVQAIRMDVQRSLDNGTKIDALRLEQVALVNKVSELQDKVEKLQSKNGWWDIINSIGFTLAGIIGYWK